MFRGNQFWNDTEDGYTQAGMGNRLCSIDPANTCASSIASGSKVTRVLTADTPKTIVMDCGAWTNGTMTLGLMSGSTVAIVKLEPNVGHDSTQTPTTNPIINKFFTEWPGEVGDVLAQLKCIDDDDAIPYCDEDYCKKGRLLCEPDQLFVFVPDTHLGICDVADDFQRNPKGVKVPDFHFVALLAVLKHARNPKVCGKTTIVQLGDFVDVWETEALIWAGFAGDIEKATHLASIYYKQIPLKSTTESIECRGRTERAILAIQALQDANLERLRQLTGQIDFLVHGNHDDELRHLTSYLMDAPMKPLQGFGSTVIEGQVQKKWAEPDIGAHKAWRAEHGHEFDESNKTAAITGIEDLQTKVLGKVITFLWARLERGEKLLPRNLAAAKCLANFDHPESPFFSQDVVGTDSWIGRWQCKPIQTTLEGVLNVVNRPLGSAVEALRNAKIVKDSVEWLAYDKPDGIDLILTRLLTHGKVVRSVGAWVGEGYNFAQMRIDIEGGMRGWTLKLNPDWELDRAQRILIPKKLGASPLKPAYRVFIHAHTHTPQIQRIALAFPPLVRMKPLVDQ